MLDAVFRTLVGAANDLQLATCPLHEQMSTHKTHIYWIMILTQWVANHTNRGVYCTDVADDQ